MLRVALALTFIAAQAIDSPATTRELTEIVQRLATAWKSGDCDAWSGFVAPEWSVTHVNGAVITKAEAVRMCKAPEAAIETLTSDNMSVRRYGDAAVVTGRTIATTAGANRQTVSLRFTDVFVRRDGRWQAVASQATQIAK